MYDVHQDCNGKTTIYCSRTTVRTEKFSTNIQYENDISAITYTVNHVINTHWNVLYEPFSPYFVDLADDLLRSVFIPIFDKCPYQGQ